METNVFSHWHYCRVANVLRLMNWLEELVLNTVLGSQGGSITIQYLMGWFDTHQGNFRHNTMFTMAAKSYEL